MSDVNAYRIYVSSLLQIMEFKKLDERKTYVEMFVHVKSIISRGCTDGTVFRWDFIVLTCNLREIYDLDNLKFIPVIDHRIAS